VKLRVCELSLSEDGASCCLVVHGFARINSDQCFPFGNPVPILEDLAVQTVLEQRRREALNCPPRPTRLQEGTREYSDAVTQADIG
jgi:hypothetical protein